jgi:hypothetical protein
MVRKMERNRETSRLRDWLIIIAAAVLFICYGFFAFLTVGDKGPPDWDFGVIPDIPGESPYSTHRVRPGLAGVPAPQHVSEKPPQAMTEVNSPNVP